MPDMIKEYANTNAYRWKPDTYTIDQHQGNSVCWDDITVYLTIQNKKITQYRFDGNCSLITKAAASFLGDLIENIGIETILLWNYQTLQKEWLEVSPRRKRAAIIALIAAQNALYAYQWIEKQVTFDEILYD